MKKRNQLWFAIVILLLSSTAMRAQTQSGTYTTYVGGKAIVLDQYQVMSNADGTLRSEAALGAPGGGIQQKAVTIAVNHRPVSFALSLSDKVLLAAEFKGATVTVRKADQPGTDLQTKATLILENLLWHQFVFLLDQYDDTKGGLQSFVAFLPSQALDYPITVERVGMPAYQTADVKTKTYRYHIVANKVLELEMWTDDVTRVPFLFYNAAQQLKVVRTGFEGLAEVVLVDAPKAAAYQPPAYAVASMFREQEVTVGAGTEWTLPATLTLPTGTGPFPAVVLVHGSGPNDRDETIGPNKPFQDLAQGFASQGIAVLRYDKRTRVYPGKVMALPNFTVKEETTDDALAAVALLRQTQQIDQKRIFVLGHSLGGMLIPRIGLADQGIAGLIVFAGATRPLEDEWVRQFEYIYGLRGPLTPNQKAEIEGYKQQAARVKRLAPADTNSKELLLMVPPSYWLDLRGYFPPDAALKLKQPILILQGERDYNVTMDAFHDWQRSLGQRPSVTYKSYPKLDHLFLEGTGPASDADYARPRNIPKYVVDDIVTWIKKN